MLHLRFLLLMVCVFAGQAIADMQCDSKDHGVIGNVLYSCPGIFDSPDKEYCCYDIEHSKVYCCDQSELIKTGLGIIIPIVIAVAVIISLCACCISCLCCSCCPWYRRRRAGAVYGKVQGPSVVHVIQTPSSVPVVYPQQHVQQPYSGEPSHVTGMPQQPPPYTSEAYAKQAPYNPNYAQ